MVFYCNLQFMTVKYFDFWLEMVVFNILKDKWVKGFIWIPYTLSRNKAPVRIMYSTVVCMYCVVDIVHEGVGCRHKALWDRGVLVVCFISVVCRRSKAWQRVHVWVVLQLSVVASLPLLPRRGASCVLRHVSGRRQEQQYLLVCHGVHHQVCHVWSAALDARVLWCVLLNQALCNTSRQEIKWNEKCLSLTAIAKQGLKSPLNQGNITLTAGLCATNCRQVDINKAALDITLNKNSPDHT